jgi:hypothetical protein
MDHKLGMIDMGFFLKEHVIEQKGFGSLTLENHFIICHAHLFQCIQIAWWMSDLIWSSFIGNGNPKIVNYLKYILKHSRNQWEVNQLFLLGILLITTNFNHCYAFFLRLLFFQL